LGISIAGAPGEVTTASGSLVRLNPAFVSLSLFRYSSRLSSLRGVAIVLCRRDCPQHIPSQGTAHDDREQPGPVTQPSRCGRIWCEFLTVRATPPRATCCWPRPWLAQAAASTVRNELAQTGGILSCPVATPIEQPGRIVLLRDSSLYCPVRSPLRNGAPWSGLGSAPGAFSRPPSHPQGCFSRSPAPAAVRFRHSA
jgi:hypothetical protein